MKLTLQRKKLIIEDIDFEHSRQYKYIERKTLCGRESFFTGKEETTWYANVKHPYNGKMALFLPRFFPISKIGVDFDEVITDKSCWESDPVSLTMKSKPRDEFQQEIKDFLLGEGLFSHLNKKNRRGLFAATGSGKTFLTISYIASKGIRSLINCVDSRAIKTWKDEFLKHTNIKEEEIGVISGSDNLMKFHKKIDDYKVLLLSGKTVSSMVKKGKLLELEEALKALKFGILIHDEAHMNMLIMFHLEMLTCNRYTLYLTATPSRNIYYENDILRYMLPTEKSGCLFYEEPAKRFILKRISFDSGARGIKGITLPGGFQFARYVERVRLAEEYSNAFLEAFYPVLVDSVKRLSTSNAKVAVVCKTLNEVKFIADYLKNVKKVKSPIGVFSSEIEDIDERFKETEKRIIITTNKAMEGIINIKNLENIILLHPIKSEPLFLQTIGRIRNEYLVDEDGKEYTKNAIVYVFVDNAFRKLHDLFNGGKRNIRSVLKDYEEISLASSHNVVEE